MCKKVEKDLKKVVSCGIEKIDSLFNLNDNKGFEPGYTMFISEKKYDKEALACDIANSLGYVAIYCDCVGHIKDELKRKYPDTMMIYNLTTLEKLENMIKVLSSVSKDEKTCIIISINQLLKVECLKAHIKEDDIQYIGIVDKINLFLRNNLEIIQRNNIFVFLLNDIKTIEVGNPVTSLPNFAGFLAPEQSINTGRAGVYMCNTIFKLVGKDVTVVKSIYANYGNSTRYEF